jgi:hypothetical protein
MNIADQDPAVTLAMLKVAIVRLAQEQHISSELAEFLMHILGLREA